MQGNGTARTLQESMRNLHVYLIISVSILEAQEKLNSSNWREKGLELSDEKIHTKIYCTLKSSKEANWDKKNRKRNFVFEKKITKTCAKISGQTFLC